MRGIWAQGMWIAAQEATQPDEQMESKQSSPLKSCLLGIVHSKKGKKKPQHTTKHGVPNFFIIKNGNKCQCIRIPQGTKASLLTQLQCKQGFRSCLSQLFRFDKHQAVLAERSLLLTAFQSVCHRRAYLTLFLLPTAQLGRWSSDLNQPLCYGTNQLKR